MEDKEKNTQIPVIRLDRQLKYEGNILKIYEDKVLANGHEARWDFIHHDGAAAVLPVADDGKILMVRQYRNALDRYTLEIPAGKLDAPGEPKVECAFRELEEETGYRVESPENLDEDEVINVVPCSLGELEDMIYTGKITDGKTIAAIMAYARKYRSEDKKDTMVKG